MDKESGMRLRGGVVVAAAVAASADAQSAVNFPIAKRPESEPCSRRTNLLLRLDRLVIGAHSASSRLGLIDARKISLVGPMRPNAMPQTPPVATLTRAHALTRAGGLCRPINPAYRILGASQAAIRFGDV